MLGLGLVFGLQLVLGLRFGFGLGVTVRDKDLCE